MSVRRLSKAPRGFLVCPLPDVFDLSFDREIGLQLVAKATIMGLSAGVSGVSGDQIEFLRGRKKRS